METGLVIVLALLGASTLTAIAVFTACLFLYCVRPQRRKFRKRADSEDLADASEGGPTPTTPTAPSVGTRELLMDSPSLETEIEPLVLPAFDGAALERELAPGENCFLGRLIFALEFRARVKELAVEVSHAEGLRPPYADLAPLHPFVTLLIAPDTRHVVATRPQRRTRDPRWHQVFVFEGFPSAHLRGRQLVLTVKTSAQPLGPGQQTIGEVRVALQALRLSDQRLYLQRYLQACPILPPTPALPGPAGAYLGEIEVALCYVPGEAQLKVVVLRARNLRHANEPDQLDTFARVSLRKKTEAGPLLQSARSKTAARTEHPGWNETFAFPTPPPLLKELAVDLTVMCEDAEEAEEQLLGSVTFGAPRSNTCELHWNTMLRHPGQTVTYSHLLLPPEDAT